MAEKATDSAYKGQGKRDKNARFLSPIALRLTMPENDPRRPQMFRELRGEAAYPKILIHGGQSSIPMIEPALTTQVPNVRISFVLQSISHAAIEGGGVPGVSADSGPFITLATQSPATNIQQPEGTINWVLPPAGDTSVFPLVIYDALVPGACANFASFPVTHSATVTLNGNPLGLFEGTDNSTLASTGFYNLHYTIVAEDGPRVSHFHFSGKVNVVCSAASAL
jgi:hypothetical protein